MITREWDHNQEQTTESTATTDYKQQYVHKSIETKKYPWYSHQSVYV